MCKTMTCLDLIVHMTYYDFKERNINMATTDGDLCRPSALDNITVNYVDGKRIVTCFCGEKIAHSIVPHLKKRNPSEWSVWKHIFVELSSLGYSLKRIMRLFSASN